MAYLRFPLKINEYIQNIYVNIQLLPSNLLEIIENGLYSYIVCLQIHFWKIKYVLNDLLFLNYISIYYYKTLFYIQCLMTIYSLTFLW